VRITLKKDLGRRDGGGRHGPCVAAVPAGHQRAPHRVSTPSATRAPPRRRHIASAPPRAVRWSGAGRQSG